MAGPTKGESRSAFFGPITGARLWIFALATCLAATFADARAHTWQDCPTIFDLAYGFGTTVFAILREHRFGMREWGGTYWTYAHRLPFVPFFLAALALFFHQVRFVSLAKNLLAATLWLYAATRVARGATAPLAIGYALLVLTFFLPYNTGSISQINIEEGYLFFMLTALAAILFTRSGSDYANTALLVAAIYLTKSSLALVCLIAAGWVIWQDRTRHNVSWRSLIPVAALLLSAAAWGGYIYHRTGVFAAGVDASSWNGWNLHKGNNALAVQLYPRTNLDLLEHSHFLDPPSDRDFQDEWSRQRWELAMGSSYIKAHPREVLRMDMAKLKVMLYSLEAAPLGDDKAHRPLVALVLLIDHLAVALALYLALRHRDANAALFCLLLLAYIVPYLTGFLYQRHMVPLYGTAFFYNAVTLGRHIQPASRSASLTDTLLHANRQAVP